MTGNAVRELKRFMRVLLLKRSLVLVVSEPPVDERLKKLDERTEEAGDTQGQFDPGDIEISEDGDSELSSKT